MLRSLVLLALAAVVPAQDDPKPAKPSGSGGVRFDSRGWPILPGGDAPPPAPQVESRPPASGAESTSSRSRGDVVTGTADMGRSESAVPVASGMQLDSPLQEVFRATHSPAAFRSLGGVVVWWRVTVHGAHGEAIGIREVEHTADCGFAERDRIEYQNGPAYARVGASVSVGSDGIARPKMVENAADELMVFGLQLRMPWCFGDDQAFAVLRRDVVQRQNDRLGRIVIERRPPPAYDLLGPEENPAPRDHFEILYEPSTGEPREIVHRFARSLETRRMLLEDWREVGGVRMPFRRIYVDEALRPTTTIELLDRPKSQRLSEREFRIGL